MPEVKLTFVVEDGGNSIKRVLGGAQDELRKVGEASEDASRRGASAMDALGGGLLKVAAAAGGVATAYKAVGEVFNQINLADNLNDLSKRTGIATETLSAYKLAAEASGTSLEGLATGFKFLSKNIADGNDALAGVLRTSGDALKMRDLRGVVSDLAGVFEKLPDGPTKARLAIELFGRAGTELIPFLNEGRTGLENWAAAAERAGVVISGNTARAADQFNDSLVVLRANVSGLAMTAAEALLPTLNQLADSTTLWANANNALVSSSVETWARGAASAIESLTPAVREAVYWYSELTNAVAQSAAGIGGGSLLTPAAQSRAAGLRPELADMSAANNAGARGIYSYNYSGFVGPMPQRGGSPSSSYEAQVRGILGSGDSNTLSAAKADSAALHDNLVAASDAALGTSLGVGEIDRRLQASTASARSFTDTFAQGLTSTFDALLSNSGKVNPLDLMFQNAKRSAVSYFSEFLPGAAQAGFSRLQSISSNALQSLAGMFRNSPAGNMTALTNGTGASFSDGGGMSFEGGMSMADGSIGIGGADGSVSSIDAGGGASSGIGSAGMAAMTFGITLGLESLGSGLQAAHQARHNRMTAKQSAAAGKAGFGNTLNFGIVPDNVYEGMPDWVFDTLFGPGLSEAFAAGAMTKKEIARAPLRDILVQSRLARTQAVSDDDRVRGATYASVLDFMSDRNGNIIPYDTRGDRAKHEIRQLMADFGVANPGDLLGAVAAADTRTGQVRGTFGGQFSLMGYLTGGVTAMDQAAWMNGLSQRAGRLGLSDAMIQSENRRMAATAGIDLQGALVGLNESRLQAANEDGIKTQEEYNKLVGEAVKLFSVDVPNGLDVTAIAMASMEQTTRGSIINMETFNKALERTGSIAQGLQSTLTGGISSGISGAIGGVIAGGNLSTAGIRSAINGSIVQGATGQLTSQLVNSITDSSIFKSRNADLFTALQSGNASAISTAIANFGDVTDLVSTQLEALVPAIKAVRAAYEESAAKADEYYASAKGIAASKEAYNFSLMSGRGKVTVAKGAASSFEALYEKAMADGVITADEYAKLSPASSNALSLLSSAQGGVTPGSSAFREITKLINNIYDMTLDFTQTAGDTIVYKEVQSGKLTVDELIVRNVRTNGGTVDLGHSSAGAAHVSTHHRVASGETAYVRTQRMSRARA